MLINCVVIVLYKFEICKFVCKMVCVEWTWALSGELRYCNMTGILQRYFMP